ncbi:LOW QUALITY PROTEIN: hypothetical protein SETIT_2G028100v2 [Setaria italica]|uniref:Uncharacterized protein n=1 Tax=Setaria italica TaxID=4555 RepID=A0A368PUG3_SETIT|nr:LOW QUALITY PROTEIN: hypothetical protein SETIT_2G028100v2 [Setaria italica]
MLAEGSGCGGPTAGGSLARGGWRRDGGAYRAPWTGYVYGFDGRSRRCRIRHHRSRSRSSREKRSPTQSRNPSRVRSREKRSLSLSPRPSLCRLRSRAKQSLSPSRIHSRSRSRSPGRRRIRLGVRGAAAVAVVVGVLHDGGLPAVAAAGGNTAHRGARGGLADREGAQGLRDGVPAGGRVVLFLHVLDVVQVLVHLRRAVGPAVRARLLAVLVRLCCVVAGALLGAAVARVLGWILLACGRGGGNGVGGDCRLCLRHRLLA